MAKGKHLVVGLMSGTSADGVDAALLETDGKAHIRALAFVDRPYTNAERELIRRAARHALTLDVYKRQALRRGAGSNAARRLRPPAARGAFCPGSALTAG